MSPARPAALTRGPGGVARRYGSSWPAAAAGATAAAKAGTHHAAALMAGPERAAWLGSGQSGGADRREVAAEPTPEPRTQPGEPGGATPGSEPGRSAASLAQFQFRLPPAPAADRSAGGAFRDVIAWVPREQRLLRTDSSLRKAAASHKFPSLR